MTGVMTAEDVADGVGVGGDDDDVEGGTAAGNC
jgi:hypothetical protein